MEKTYAERQAELEKRIKFLACTVIKFCKKLPNTPANLIIIKQLLRAVCSIGANYAEACEAESRNDFSHKMAISKKEAKETLYWLELLAEENPNHKEELRCIYSEAREVYLIFSKAVATSKSRQQ